jgi:hypothetical protein
MFSKAAYRIELSEVVAAAPLTRFELGNLWKSHCPTITIKCALGYDAQY